MLIYLVRWIYEKKKPLHSLTDVLYVAPQHSIRVSQRRVLDHENTGKLGSWLRALNGL